MAVPRVRFPIFPVVRVIGIVVAVLVLLWTVHYRGGLALISENKDLIFNVHPVLMVVGLVILNGEGPFTGLSFCSRKLFVESRELVEIFIVPLVLLKSASVVKNVSNSLNMPKGTLWAAGFVTFWYPGGSRNSRASLLPWHVFVGIYIYALAIATCTTGFLEKATFLQTNKVISRYSMEALLVNSLGILIVVLAGFVVLGVVSPVYGKGDVPRGIAE
ncbi:UNVERIFIED_CONTAM: putative transmembrane ascorbate ferrireductase 2 [Sesamum radiatum]|uniref:Transmembrane ascorbate ferrireductase 2 n=1 Tax=Sesamum radiatum TaxID=300843 RepID=A0AAW2P370_SESRA